MYQLLDRRGDSAVEVSADIDITGVDAAVDDAADARHFLGDGELTLIYLRGRHWALML